MTDFWKDEFVFVTLSDGKTAPLKNKEYLDVPRLGCPMGLLENMLLQFGLALFPLLVSVCFLFFSIFCFYFVIFFYFFSTFFSFSQFCI